MISIALRVIACLAFLAAAINQTIVSQPPLDLIAWGLLAWVLSTLFAGVGPQWNYGRPPA